MSGHTPEPWATEYRENADGYSQEIFDAKGETIATCAWYKVKVDARTTTTNREENARRIVACVNVLAPIPTEYLEQAGTGMLSEAALKVGELTKQRDELLEVSRCAVTMLDERIGCGATGYDLKMLEWARGIISRIGEIH